MSLSRILRNMAVLVILAAGVLASAPRAAANKPQRCYYLHDCYRAFCAAGYACSSYNYCCPVKK